MAETADDIGDRPAIGVVHLGIGAFFRAFGVPWLEDVMAAAGGDWGVVGVSLRSAAVRDRLGPQDTAYHCLQRGSDGTELRRVTALRRVLFLGEERAEVLAAMADSAVSLVSLTVTEKGYAHVPGAGRLDLNHPQIVHDIGAPDAPLTAPGLIVAALRRRRDAGLRPFTCLSCDNLPGNGEVLRNVVLGLAEQVDPRLAGWIAHEGRFPATMVDRIVPAATVADVDEVERRTGLRDAAVVVHEPFRQWVIEDRFVDDVRPAFEAAGVVMTDAVAPYELMKLRCLNGTHSAIAYLGVLAGKETVAEAVADQGFARFVKGLWREEIVPSLEPPPSIDLAEYTAALMQRYRNPGIAHRTMQIAMDGSQKLPQRILAATEENLAGGRPFERLALVVAAWIRFLGGVTEDGAPYDLSDPLADRLQELARSKDPVGAVMAVEVVFGRTLPNRTAVVDTVREAYDRLAGEGVQAVLEGMP
ncbi:MAG: mannitol dehydrogenase family protein [Rhodobacter sp.]|nr:mannitol dehydrogenase family protein [Rhodobacter sp.]